MFKHRQKWIRKVFCLWLNSRSQASVTATIERYVADMNYVK